MANGKKKYPLKSHFLSYFWKPGIYIPLPPPSLCQSNLTLITRLLFNLSSLKHCFLHLSSQSYQLSLPPTRIKSQTPLSNLSHLIPHFLPSHFMPARLLPPHFAGALQATGLHVLLLEFYLITSLPSPALCLLTWASTSCHLVALETWHILSFNLFLLDIVPLQLDHEAPQDKAISQWRWPGNSMNSDPENTTSVPIV